MCHIFIDESIKLTKEEVSDKLTSTSSTTMTITGPEITTKLDTKVNLKEMKEIDPKSGDKSDLIKSMACCMPGLDG